MPGLVDLAKEWAPNMVGSLAGGAIGAGIGSYGTKQLEGEKDPDFQKRQNENMTMGGIAGAGAGFAAPLLGKLMPDKTAPASRMAKTWDYVRPGNNDLTAGTVGASIGAGGGYAGGKVLGGVVSKGIDMTSKNYELMAARAMAVGDTALADKLKQQAVRGAGALRGAGRLGYILSALGGIGGAVAGTKYLNSH